jgi:hypothetical protein
MGLNSFGCDSTAILNLTINQPVTPTFTQQAPICINSTFTLPTTSTNSINGTWSPAPNNQTTTTYTFTPANGACATSTTMTVTVNTSPTAPTFNQVAAICKDGSFTLPSSSLEAVAGSWSPAINNQTTTTYTFTPNAGQCALTTTMTVIVKQPSSSTASPLDSCSSATWNNVIYTTSGIKTWIGTNAVGCDSIVTINITIKQPSNSSSTTTNCSSYTWNGVNYTSSGTYTWKGTNAAGCDSTATLNLTINQPENYDSSITATGFYPWNINGVLQTLYQSGLYSDSSCGVKILRLTVRSNTVVYPNPNNGAFNVNLAAVNNTLTNEIVISKNVTLTIYDALGKRVLTQSLKAVYTDRSNINFRNYSNGIYFIKIQSADKSINYSTKIFKSN